MLPLLDAARWLLVNSSTMADADRHTAMKLLLDRTASRGVSIAFDLNWQPKHWGLEDEAIPTTEVKRRLRPLSEAATLISCTASEAEAFFHSHEPVAIHEAFPQRPAVVITAEDGSVHWCLGGRSGRVSSGTGTGPNLSTLLDELCDSPELVGGDGIGTEAIADPAALSDLLRTAMVPRAAATGTGTRGEGDRRTTA